MALLRDYFHPNAQPAPDPAQALPQTPEQAAALSQQLDQENSLRARQRYAEESPFSAGIARGAEELPASLGAVAGLAQGAVGDVQGGRARLRRAAAELQQAQQLTPQGADTFSDALHSGHLGAYAANQIGALIPGTAATVATSLASGGIGGLVQGGLRRAALGGAEDVAANVAKNTLGKTVGELAGAAAAGTAQSAGSTAQYVDPNAPDAQFESQSRKALAGAGALGALQAIPSVALMARYGFGEAAALKAAQSVPKSLLGRVAKEGVEQGVIGGATNAATVAVDHAVHQWVTGAPQAAPALPDYVNAVASGVIGGVALGGPAGLFHSAPAGESRTFAENLRAAKNKVGAAIDEQINKVREPNPNRPKPGEPYPDNEPLDAKAKFDENLRAVQDNDDDFHASLLKDAQPYNIKDGVLNGPASGLVDPTRMQTRAASYESLFKTPTERTFASILNDEQYTADAVPGIKAAAKAFTDGFDTLNPKQKKAVGDFASRLEPDQLEKFKRVLATSNEIVKQGAKITRNASDDTSTVPDFAPNKSRQTTGETPENVGAEDIASLSQNEGEAPLPRGYVDDESWNRATYVGPRSVRGTPDEQNIRLTKTKDDGTSYGTDLNIMRAASSVAKTPEGKLFIDQNGANRKVNTAIAIASDAIERGFNLPPDAFATGKRLFPGDDGKITPAEANAIRARLSQPNRGATPLTETPGRAAPTREFTGAQSDVIDTAEGDIGGLAAKQATALGPDAKVNTARENRALENRARRAAEAVGIPPSAPPHIMFERAQKLPKSPARDAVLASVRLMADTDPGLASRIEQLEPGNHVVQNEGHKPEGAPLAPGAKPNAGASAADIAAAKAPKRTLKDVEQQAKAAMDYAQNPPDDFTARDARAKAAEMDKVSKQAAAKAKQLGEDHPAYQRMDDLRMNAKDAANVLREVADKQDAADKTGMFDKIEPASDDPAKPSTLRESIEKLKASPEFEKIKNALDVLRKRPIAKGEHGLRDLTAEKRILDRLTKAFGVDELQIKNASESADPRMNNARAKLENGVVYVNDKLNGAERVSSILHEFGHHLLDSKMASATREQRQAIYKEFALWKRQHAENSKTFDVRASRAPVFTSLHSLEMLGGRDTAKLSDLTPERAAYFLDFDEFMADSIARTLESNDDVRNIIRDAGGGWFARVAQVMKMTYDLLRGHSSGVATPPAAVRDWVHSLFHPEEASSATGAGSPSPSSGAGGGHPPGNKPPFSTASGAQPSPGAQSPHDVTSLLGQKSRGILEDVFTRRGVIEQLLKHATPDQARDLLTYDTRLETAINLGYKLWAAGQIKLDAPEALGPLRQMNEAVLKIFGLPSQRQLADQILSDLKAGNVNKTYDPGRVIENKERAKLQAQAAGGSGVAYTRLRARRAVDKTYHAVVDKMNPVYSRIMQDMDRRMRETNVPALRKLASIVHLQTGEVGREGQQTLAQAVTQQRAKFWEQAEKLTAGLSARDQVAISRALRTKGTLKDAKLEAKRAELAKFMEGMYSYMKSKGVDVGKVDNYWPVVLEPTKVQNREQAFRTMLERPALEAGMRDYLKSKGWDVTTMSKQDMVDALYRTAAYKPDYTLGGHSYADTGTAPGGKEFRTRVSEFIYKSGDADAIKEFAKFQSNDLEKILIPYISHAVRRAEFINRLGKTKDMKASTLSQLLDQAKSEGATADQIELAKNYVDASLGAYGTGPNPFLQKLTGSFDSVFGTKLSDVSSQQYRQMSNAIIAYQNLRTLGLGIFGNLIDPLGVWVRSSSAGTTWSSYKEAYKAAFKGKDPSYLRDLAHALGTVERHAVGEALAYGYGGDMDNLSGWSSRVNRALFKANGMETVTNFARLAATEAANKFLLRHKDLSEPHSARYLRELGLKPADIVEDPQHPGYVKLTPKVEKALYQFVDESVLRPTATQRPLWQNDPHFAVLAQYKGYLYSFYNTITRRMLHEAGNGNLKGLMPIIGYMAVSMAAELAREAVQYPDGGNPRRKNWGAGDYLALAADRSGLAGPRISALSDSFGDVQRGNIPGQSITGPSVAQASELVRVVRGRENPDSAFIHALPGQSLYKGWVSHADSGDRGGQTGRQDNAR